MSADGDTVREITETLVTGGYDGTEGEDGSGDTTWTDFGIVCGIAERLEARCGALTAALEAIRALPSERDLLTNAVARAMYEIGGHALAEAAPEATP